MGIEYKRKNYCYIEPFDMVNVTKMGDIIKVQHIENVNTECQIIRLPNNQYKVKSTGEIKDFKEQIKNRSQGNASLGKTRRAIRETIITNCSNDDMEKCMFITLTYKEDNMNDSKRLDNDLNIFIKKFRYKYGKDIQYIMMPAPQLKRKNWSFHVHVIFIFDKKAPFIDNKDIQEIWGHGITNNKSKLYGKIDDLGLYFLSHLKDMPLDEVIKNGLEYDEKDIKKVYIDYKTGEQLEEPSLIVKGIRTRYFPPNFKILRTSRGLKKPSKERKCYAEERKEVGYRIPTSSYTLQIIDNEKNWSNTFKTEEYNLKRKPTVSSPNSRDLEAIEFINGLEEQEVSMNEVYKSNKELNPSLDPYDF